MGAGSEPRVIGEWVLPVCTVLGAGATGFLWGMLDSASKEPIGATIWIIGIAFGAAIGWGAGWVARLLAPAISRGEAEADARSDVYATGIGLTALCTLLSALVLVTIEGALR